MTCIPLCVCVYVCACVSVFVCVWVCVCVCMHACVSECVYACIHAYMWKYVSWTCLCFVCVCVCVCVHVWVSVCMHAYVWKYVSWTCLCVCAVWASKVLTWFYILTFVFAFFILAIIVCIPYELDACLVEETCWENLSCPIEAFFWTFCVLMVIN